MGSEPSGNCGPVVVPCPGAVPLRSGAAPGDAGTRRWIQRQRWHRTKRQRPGPCGSRCPGPARSLQRAAAAGRGRGSAPSGKEGRRLLPEERERPRDAPGARGSWEGKLLLRAAPGCVGHPPGTPGTHRAVLGEGLQSGAGMLRRGRRCRCHERGCFKIYFLVCVRSQGSIFISFQAKPVRDWFTLREDQSLP